jgi:hypothetical protein
MPGLSAVRLPSSRSHRRLLPVVEKIQHLQLDIVWWSAFEPPPTGVFAGEEVTLMEHDHLIGQVQHRARLASRGEAEVAVRTTLQTLEERISEGTYQNLIAQLPQGMAVTKRFRDRSTMTR